MGDTFMWTGKGLTTDWNDPTNWRQAAGDISGVNLFTGFAAQASRAPGAGDDAYFPAIVPSLVTGGGAADTVLFQGDGLLKILSGTGTEHYSFRELILGFGGSNAVLSNALLDAGSTTIPVGGYLDVSAGAVGTDPDGRAYTASLGVLTLEQEPFSGRFLSRLVLGDRTVEVTELRNGNLGVGNGFDPGAGIEGSGTLHYPPSVHPALPYVTTPFVFGGPNPSLPPRIDHLDFGTVAVGEAETLTFSLANATAGSALPLIGALQTAVNGAQVTDPALSGGGVTPGNFYLPAGRLERQDFSITLAGTTPHSLDGQAIHLAFADGTGLTLPITGTVVERTPPPPPEPPPPDLAVDWNALAAGVQAHFAATGQWF